MSKSAIFVLSGFLAFLLYALLLYSLLLERHNKEAEKILLDLNKKDEQAIDLNLEDLPSEKKNEKIEKVTEKQGDFLEPKEEPKEEPEESLEDIFSSLNDFQEKTDKNAQKDEQKNEQEEEQRRLREQQRLKQNQENQEMLKGLQQNLNQFTQKLESVKNKTLDLQVPKQDGVDEKAYQKWYAQIYQILYKGWRGVFYHKASVSALIMITKDGEFDYTILSYSDFKDYNKSVMTLLDDLKKVDFPPYPGGNMISIKVNFTTKEEQ
ncbi:TonB C-terminal domain-containing protein [Helicobacter pylori]|uniref:energy transducer TonB n=1 Tax=Helicobacter pylori TaxID=210 RepID=UPI00165C188E|nr:energy transducer TonB [Helicobacter pylori]WQT05607.1 TonB C-terminal domain-containing protein [Helicobacter pylori]WQT07142.1 TonB C-terminal domain-containing protein [Helicobacter pylori]WQT11472.1 TonB C-terminal domain-containing protein [Helicobacter pylori]WQT51695.1 TonB C-terminal domain-containing protein [Helicobacter pylori]WQT61279.1 TonB C-terminal domain-containing protein [Helicobacter pylori]